MKYLIIPILQGQRLINVIYFNYAIECLRKNYAPNFLQLLCLAGIDNHRDW